MHQSIGPFQIGLEQKNKDETEGTNLHFPLFVCTKENVNLSSQPLLCSFVVTQFERGLLKSWSPDPRK